MDKEAKCEINKILSDFIQAVAAVMAPCSPALLSSFLTL